jgi:hypothetical protein
MKQYGQMKSEYSRTSSAIEGIIGTPGCPCEGYSTAWDSSQRSASIAAMQPVPAAVIAWR